MITRIEILPLISIHNANDTAFRVTTYRYSPATQEETILHESYHRTIEDALTQRHNLRSLYR